MARNASLREQDDDKAEPTGAQTGRSIEGWIATALEEQAARASRDAAERAPAEAKARRGSRTRAETDREPADDVLEAATASERRAIETAAQTAAALGSVASWIERAQERLTETTAAASRAQEDTARVVSGAVGAIGQRLEEIERKVEGAGSGAVSEALRAIERLEARLVADPIRTAPRADETHPDRVPYAPPGESPAFEQALRGFEARIAELSERVATAPKPIARRALSRPDEIRSAVAEIRTHQAVLGGSPPAPRPVADRPAYADAPAQLRREIEDLRRSLDGVATRRDLGRVEDSLQDLAREIAEARANGGDAAAAAREIETLQAQVRSLEAARLPVAETTLRRDIGVLSHKLDIAAASGIDPAVAEALSAQLREIADLTAGIATPDGISGLTAQLAALEEEVAEISRRQIAPEEFTSLRHEMQGMRALFATAAEASGRNDAAARPAFDLTDGAAVETMLQALMEKLDRVERKVPDPEALAELERQVQGLASSVGEFGDRPPAIAALEGSLADLLHEVASWRDGAAEAADRAARAAIAETLGALPRPAEVEGRLQDLMALYEEAEDRTHRDLAGVNARLEEVMNRLSALEGDRHGAPTMGPASLVEPAPAGGPTPGSRPARGEASLPVPSLPAPASDTLLHEADRPLPPAQQATLDDVLLEPGAGRPGAPSAPGLGGDGDPSDIKSSFIAAARRAAQAANEAAAPKPAGARISGSALPSISPTELVRRLRALIEARRRPLLIGAATVALALGALQIARNLSDEPALAPGEQGSASTPSPETPARETAAAVPSVPATAGVPDGRDPVTTQSIGPDRNATAEPALAPPPPAPAAPAEAPPGPKAALPVATAAVSSRSPVAPEATPLPAGLKSAAAAGQPLALYELATRTAEGRGVPRDAKAAAGLFEKAAEKGLAPAQYRTGNIYERGVGVPRDVEAARAWYRRAAEAGNVRAMHNLAVLIAEGGAGKADYPAAIAWFQKAADHGVRDSQFNLAVLYARGLGVPQDLGRSYHWLAVAASGGDEDAGRKRDEVAAKLAPAELQRAKAGFEKWRPTAGNPAANEVQPPAAGWPETAAKRASR